MKKNIKSSDFSLGPIDSSEFESVRLPEEIVALNKEFAVTESLVNEEAPITDEKTNRGPTIKKKKKKKPQTLIPGKDTYNAFELYKSNMGSVPKLLDPFLQTAGLASLVGTSDSGKSTFLRHLSLSIVLGLDKFLGYDLNSLHKRVIYVSTEDDANSIGFTIKKQIDHLVKENAIANLKPLNNLDFIFETTDLLKKLNASLKAQPVDLIIVDAFSDVFTKEINANTQVRQFLNDYNKLAWKHNCLIIFLHHTGKRTNKMNPSKDSIIGSQAFEAKMRVVLELRPNRSDEKQKELWVLKSNFLERKYKNKSYILEFTEDLIFKNSNIRGTKQSTAKSSNPDLIKKVLELNSKGLSTRKIEARLENTEYAVSKSVAAIMIKENEEKA